MEQQPQQQERKEEEKERKKKAYYALRVEPGQDLKDTILAFCDKKQIQSGFIATCVGSLTHLHLRLANTTQTYRVERKFEITSLVGTICGNGTGAHLHMCVADNEGLMRGGHVLEGCLVFTTAEVVIGVLDGTGISFDRVMDERTGFPELVVHDDEDGLPAVARQPASATSRKELEAIGL